MAILATIRSPPALEDYTPLEEHQSQTPETFHGGKPVLHYHASGAKAWIPKSQRGKLPFFPADLSTEPTAPEGIALGDSLTEFVEQKVDLFVNSQTLTIFSPAAEAGLAIPYPMISIHAIKTIGSGDKAFRSVYMQLELSDENDDDFDDYNTVELTLIPHTPAAQTSESEDPAATPVVEEALRLFGAVTECSNLNPDPKQDDEDEDDEDRIVFEGEEPQAIQGFSGVFSGASDGGLPPPMPGSGGWITAENMHEFFDADGNWIGEAAEEEEEGVSGELGEGAGTVHRRDDEEEAVDEKVTKEEADSKRARLD